MKNTVIKVIGAIIQVIVILAVFIGGCVAASIGISGLIEAAGVLLGTTLGSTTFAIILWRIMNTGLYCIICYYGVASASSVLNLLVECFIKYIKKIGGFISSKLSKRASEAK